MHKEVVTYTDYNGVERTETFLFNLSEAELTEMEYGVSGGMTAMLQKITDAKDLPKLISLFKDLVLRAYGVKSEDGRRFRKTEELRQEFVETPAYSILFMKYATNDEEAAKFVREIMPPSIPRDKLIVTNSNTNTDITD